MQNINFKSILEYYKIDDGIYYFMDFMYTSIHAGLSRTMFTEWKCLDSSKLGRKVSYYCHVNTLYIIQQRACQYMRVNTYLSFRSKVTTLLDKLVVCRLHLDNSKSNEQFKSFSIVI